MDKSRNNETEKSMIQISGFKENETEVWVASDEWFHPIVLNEENVASYCEPDIIIFEKLIKKWKSHAEELKKTYQPIWFVKGATIRFLYLDKMYQLYPSAIGVSSELFEHMAEEIEQDLKETGCAFVRYEGTLD